MAGSGARERAARAILRAARAILRGGWAPGPTHFGVNFPGRIECVDDRDVGFVMVGRRLSAPAFAGIIFALKMLLSALKSL
ncbi:MAG: hypothetical protein ACI9U2_001206 [Bradymonadia bacterium]|jgi:hypothetical protein